MPQLPISLASPQPASASAGQQSAAAAFGAEAGDGREGLNFSAILGKQMKGVTKALPEGSENAKVGGHADVDGNGEQPADAMNPVCLQVDFAALTVAFPPVVVQQKSEIVGEVPSARVDAAALSLMDIQQKYPLIQQKHEAMEEVPSARVDASNPILGFPLGGKAIEPAEIAGNGKNLPQRVSDEKLFADKLASFLVESPAAKADPHSASELQLSANAQGGAVAVPMRQVEHVSALPIKASVGSIEWGGALGEKVVWMATQNHQVAELHLNPPSLGPLEVRLTVSNDQATALFVSHQPAVREAIETALPRLREMLADNGIMLGNATVSSESFSRQQAFDQGNGNERGAVRDVGAIPGPSGGGGAALGLSHEGMVDLFA